jgi:serine/threonine-protein kinase
MQTEEATWIGIELANGRYEVLDVLGEGGMGFVFKAFDSHLGTEVVVKTPKRSMLGAAGFATRFAQEIRSLVDLSHPHVVKVIDVGVHDGLPFSVMQYLSGGSLADRRRSGDDGEPLPMPLPEILPWLVDIASSLDFMHGQGYVHRDIKPENILFDAHGNVFLSDFGIAKALIAAEQPQTQRLTSAGLVLGTPEYMAPEVIMGLDYDGRADQYSLAVVVYEMLAGRIPFDGATATALMVQHTTQKPIALASLNLDLPSAARTVVERALEKKPEHRFPSCREFATALAAASEGHEPGRSAAPSQPSDAGAPKKDTVVEVRCPNPQCGKLLHLRPEHAGHKARCKACDSVVYIGEDLSVSTSPRTTAARSSARAETIVAPTAPDYRTMTARELAAVEAELRTSLVRLVLEEKDAKLPEIQVLRDAIRKNEQLKTEIDEMKKRIPRLEQEQAEFSTLAEQLGKDKEAMADATQQLEALSEPLGEDAYQGLLNGSLENQPLFLKRKECGDKLSGMKEEFDKLSEAKGFFDKAKAKARQAVLWSQMRLEESNARSLSKKIGSELIQTGSEHLMHCPQTEGVLSRVAEGRKCLENAGHAVDEARSRLEKKRTEIETAYGLEGLQYPKQVQKEILRCKRLLDAKDAEVAKLRGALPDQLLETSQTIELNRDTVFGRVVLDLRQIVARHRGLKEN